jgi:hypothetical protein
VGRYAGWGSQEDARADRAKPERMGPGMVPFFRGNGPWWKVGIGIFWIPAIIVVITLEDLMHLPQGVIWISIGAVFVGFMAYLLFWDNRASS